MNDIQILQLFGLALAAIGISALLDKEMLKKLFLSFNSNLALLFITWLLTLVLGYVLIVTHKFSQNLLANIILVLWYLSLIKGLFMLLFPNLTVKVMKCFSWMKLLYVFYPLLILLAWLVCLYFGFYIK